MLFQAYYKFQVKLVKVSLSFGSEQLACAVQTKCPLLFFSLFLSAAATFLAEGVIVEFFKFCMGC